MNKPLTDMRILLMFMTSTEHSARIQNELRILRANGAKVDLVSTLPNKKSQNLFDRIHQVSNFENFTFLAESNRLGSFIGGLSKLLLAIMCKFDIGKGAQVTSSDLSEFLIERGKDYDVWWAYDALALPSAALALGSLTEERPRLVYETQDLVPEYTIQIDLSQFRKRWEKRYIQEIDALITAGEAYKDYYIEQFPQCSAAQNALVWPNFAIPVLEPRASLSHPRSFVFYGNIAPDRPIRQILEAFSELDDRCTLTLIGENRIGDLLDKYILDFGLEDRVSCIGRIEASEGVCSISSFDFGIVALEGANENERRAPTSKLGTYLSAGLGIIASDLPGIRKQAGKDLNALFVSGSSSTNWGNAFLTASNLTDSELMKMKKSSHKRALQIAQSLDESVYVNVFE